MSDNSQYSTRDERFPVNPFDLFTDLICCFSNQIIHLVLYLDGRVDFEILKKAVEKASLAEPITRCRIIRDQDSLWWKEVTSFCITDHVLRLSARLPGEILYQVLSYPLDPYAGTVFQVILIENTVGDGDIIVINAHHIAMDGRGLKEFGRLIMGLYTDYKNGNQTEIPATPIRCRLLPKVSTLIPGSRAQKPSDPSYGWCSRISVPVQSFDADTYRYSILTFTADRTGIIHASRREWGITVNDFMIAVIARAIAFTIRVDSEAIIPLYTTIDLRRYLPTVPERSLVNFSTSYEVRIPVKPDESLEDTAKRVHILMNRIKARDPGVDEAIEADLLFESGYQAARDLINKQWNAILDAGSKTTIFSNTGIISSFQVNPGDPSVRNAYILPGHFQPPGFFFAFSTFEDIMTLSATYAVPAYDQDLISRMFIYIDNIIPGSSAYPGDYEELG